MIIDAPAEFWHWVDALTVQADAGDRTAVLRLDLLQAQLEVLEELTEAPAPDDETATLKPVRQSRRHNLWRVSHPYREGVALRLICFFPPEGDTVVVALFAGDKASIGDVFYNSVASRADPLIDQWRREVERSEG